MKRTVLGLDPGLARTGWGIILMEGNRLSHVAHGAVETKATMDMSARLVRLYDGLRAMLTDYQPDEIAVEEVFLNRNPQSTLKLGHARGVVMLAAAATGAPVAEHSTRLVKKALTGTGAADKVQVASMVQRLLPGCGRVADDEADALAVAIAHCHLAPLRTAGRVKS